MIAAGRDKALVAEHLGHQLGEEIRVDLVVYGHRVGKAGAGYGRYNHVKRGAWVAAIRCWIGEALDDLVVAIERVRKAMQQQQRRGVRAFAALMDEMDAHAVNVRFEVRKAIEGRLVSAPIVSMLPVVHQLSHIPQLDPIHPAIILRRIDPAGASQAFMQVVQGGLRNRDRPWLNGHVTAPLFKSSIESKWAASALACWRTSSSKPTGSTIVAGKPTLKTM